MGQFIPLIGTLRGKVGAMVIDKSGRTRLHAPGPNRTPAGVKNAFSVLAKSWPYSSTEFKNLVSNAPSVARGIGYLTGRAYRAYQLAPAGVASIQVDGAGIVPYRLSNLPGEFGEGQQLAPFTPSFTVAAGGLSIACVFGVLPTVQSDSWQMAVLILKATDTIAGTIAPGVPGAVLVDADAASVTVTGVDDRLTTSSPVGFYVVFFAVIAASEETGLPVCHGFCSGLVQVTT